MIFNSLTTVMYLPLKWWIIPLSLVLNITETVTVSLVQESPDLANLTQHEESYFTPDQNSLTLRPPSNLSRAPGPSGAASNSGEIVRWENTTQTFVWRKKRQIVGRTAQFTSVTCTYFTTVVVRISMCIL